MCVSFYKIPYMTQVLIEKWHECIGAHFAGKMSRDVLVALKMLRCISLHFVQPAIMFKRYEFISAFTSLYMNTLFSKFSPWYV